MRAIPARIAELHGAILKLDTSTLKPQLTAYPALASRLHTGLCAFEAIHPLADSATWQMVRLGGRPALSRLLA
ncbi:MAG: hypothetical protein Q8N89_02380, partial [Azonexus sp.]|nr:hypothetical protein [Azonexus sp.]